MARVRQYDMEALRVAQEGKVALTLQEIRDLIEEGQMPRCTSEPSTGIRSQRLCLIVDGVPVDYNPETADYNILE